MAVYKLFANKDATLYSKEPNKNTGLDSVIEVYNKTHFTDPFISSAEVARYLISFDQTEINDLINNRISGSQWQANLKNYIASAFGIIADSKIYVYPLAQDWNNGTGQFLDDPDTENGVSWAWRTFNEGTRWQTGSFSSYTTGSFISSNPGGGCWFTASISGSLEITQSFGTTSEKDLNINVTNIVNLWKSGSISNYGFIAKWGADNEFNPSQSVEPDIKYFSSNTNTIYPPQLEFKWNDFSFNTGSNLQGFITASAMVVSFPNNKGLYNQGSIQKFRVNVRPQYPARVYQTSSIYITNNYLPLSSSYAVKDLDTNEFIIDFDDVYTKLSADNQGNYFTVYMSGLEPERYYKMLIKTVINGETLVLDNDYYFKVING
jgi:hypothetical protein